MPRKRPASPLSAYAWLAEAGWVFMAHSAQLWADPARAGTRLAALAAEKQTAFVLGAVGAGSAAWRGANPHVIAKAAMAPARSRVRTNAKRIRKA